MRPALATILFSSLIASGCATEADPSDGSHGKGPGNGKDDSSIEAVFLDFEFDGELLTSWSYNPTKTVEDQMLYTVGQLNGEKSVGRLDKLEISNIQTEDVGDKTRISYHVKMPVAWGTLSDVPDSYTFTLPTAIDFAGQEAFVEKYGHDCVDWGAHDVDAGSMWYYYRPKRSGCQLDAGDVIALPVAVSPSSSQTTGKFPEYHKVWEDDVLRVVAIFGKNEAGATSGDAGINAYNRMTNLVRSDLQQYGFETVPADVPTNPGVAHPDITFKANLADGRSVEIVTLLVDGVRVAGPEFDARYEELSKHADVIAYAGHSGLGANIRALARKGDWVTGQYVIVIMNGCDTYAYVDSALADAHIEVNSDDPNGTKYLDIVTNAMPAYFSSNASNINTFITGLMAYDEPRTYEQIFEGVDSVQVQLVSGEEDNVYVPGYDEGWSMTESGTVAQNQEDRFATSELPAGRYTFQLTGTNDADLYVRVGAEPTTNQYDCRPYQNGSSESCSIDLSSPARIYVMVRGYAASSDYTLRGNGEGGGGGGGDTDWEGMTESGTVAADAEDRFETPELAAGRYTFELTGTNDADLYVRIGEAPTTQLYDCRPYRYGSNETCVVDLPSAAQIHVMVRGWDDSSDYELKGFKN